MNEYENKTEEDVQHDADEDDWDLDDTFTVGGWSDDETEDATENTVPVPCVALYSYEVRKYCCRRLLLLKCLNFVLSARQS